MVILSHSYFIHPRTVISGLNKLIIKLIKKKSKYIINPIILRKRILLDVELGENHTKKKLKKMNLHLLRRS